MYCDRLRVTVWIALSPTARYGILGLVTDRDRHREIDVGLELGLVSVAISYACYFVSW